MMDKAFITLGYEPDLLGCNSGCSARYIHHFRLSIYSGDAMPVHVVSQRQLMRTVVSG
jgi:hypothetical protein